MTATTSDTAIPKKAPLTAVQNLPNADNSGQARAAIPPRGCD